MEINASVHVYFKCVIGVRQVGSKEVLTAVKKQGVYTLEAEVISDYVDVASKKPLSNT